MEGNAESAARIRLIRSDDAEPQVRLRPGKRYEVVTTAIVDNDLQMIEDETEAPIVRSARLCGSESTCVAIIEVD